MNRKIKRLALAFSFTLLLIQYKRIENNPNTISLENKARSTDNTVSLSMATTVVRNYNLAKISVFKKRGLTLLVSKNMKTA